MNPESQYDGHEQWELRTPRLTIRRAVACQSDITLLHRLWADPAVMTNVGFPHGFNVSEDDIEKKLRKQDFGEYDCILIVTVVDIDEPIGEAKLVYPDDSGVARTDIKLLPAYWGKGFGTEIKRALLGYLFENTDCLMVKASPNRGNVASIKMQEAVGGRRVGEGVHEFPAHMREYTRDVPYYEYAVFRDDWIRNRGT